jgi:zona occludens toxin (predicted ATPase)
MAINIITGRPGSGKTYILTAKALEWLKRGYNIWSNYKININAPNLHFYSKVRELVSIKDGIILMDEGQIYFNARNWEALDEKLQYKLQQHRKHGLDIWATVQNIKRLDVIMRELVNRYYECKKIIGTGESAKKPWGIFVMREFDIKDAEKPDEKRERYSREFFLLKKEIYDSYDTLAEVGRDKEDEAHLKIKTFKVCPECGKEHLVG